MADQLTRTLCHDTVISALRLTITKILLLLILLLASSLHIVKRLPLKLVLLTFKGIYHFIIPKPKQLLLV
nr:hypothetical protein [Cressdnaviricota sp.]